MAELTITAEPLCRAGRKRRLVDMVLFFNEIDILEIRLQELSDVVDTFVIVESDRTFAGRAKPFFVERFQGRFAEWASKIVYHQAHFNIAFAPKQSERFANEALHRDEFTTLATKLDLAPDDIVVIADVDEVWHPRCADVLPEMLRDADLVSFVLKNYRGYTNNIGNYALNGQPWRGPVACFAGLLGTERPDRIRRYSRSPEEPCGYTVSTLTDAGWHFSSMGGAEAFWIKSQNFSHTTDPYRVVEVDAREQEVRVFTGPMSREDCAAAQRLYLDHAPDAFEYSPLSYAGFEIEQDIPAAMRANKEHYRRFFFFSDCV